MRPGADTGEGRLNDGDTVEVTRDAVVHLYGHAARLWAFNRATVYVHGEVDEIYVCGDSNVHILGKCPKVDVGMNGTAWMEEAEQIGFVIANQHGTVHASDGAKIRAYGESRIHAPSTADVVLHWFAQWHTESEVRGNLSLYRPGYCVVR